MTKGEVARLAFRPGRGTPKPASPAIIVQEDSFNAKLPTVLVVPFTGTLAASRFPGTLAVQPDNQNGLTTTSVALVFQLSPGQTRLPATPGSTRPKHVRSGFRVTGPIDRAMTPTRSRRGSRLFPVVLVRSCIMVHGGNRHANKSAPGNHGIAWPPSGNQRPAVARRRQGRGDRPLAGKAHIYAMAHPGTVVAS